MKKRYIIYIIVAIICIVSISVGVYYQVISDRQEQPVLTNEVDPEPVVDPDDPEVLVKEFNSLLTNTFYAQNNDTTAIKRLPGFEEQDIIFAAYNIKEERDGKYNVNINLPVVNIDTEVAADFNNTTNKLFSNKVAEVLKISDKYTIYNIDYVGYLNGNILSVVIKSTIKEGDNDERVRVQTYNYDVTTGKEVTLNEILEQKEISQRTANKKIEKQVKEAARRAEAVASELASQGKLTYQRDINNAMYITDYVNDFFLGKDGQLYIVYAYGNTYTTAEIDVIKINKNVNQ